MKKQATTGNPALKDLPMKGAEARDIAGGAPTTGAPSHSEFVITKLVDAASPKLYQAL